jgi:hypothetical protein
MQLSTAFRNEANMTTETPENTTPADVDDAVARAQSLYPPQFTLMLSVADSDDDRENLVRAFLLGAKHVNAELAPMWPEYVRQTVDAFLGTGEELSL